ncbi:MAG TPA: SDR family oxidoreductase [Acidimicrobiia bacterium]|nr:SDR family oxidoreductase [Acidimicrobiia bacterium]
MDLGLTGRRAAVAAGSKGLGRACAVALAAEGARVAICGRDVQALEATATEHGLVPIVADVSSPEGAARFVHDAHDALGGIDVLVPNAGGPPPGGFADITDPAAYGDAFKLNALSTITMCIEAVPAMRAQRWGRVVAITSIAVRQPIPTLILSNTARAGVTGFLKTLAREVAADGVTVNSLQPGLHATDRIRQLGGGLDALAAGIPAGVLGQPDDFGAICAFLCSEHARFLTGAAIPVDGGADAALQ